MIRRLPQDEFHYIYRRVPRLCVDVVIEKDGRVVLSKRDIQPAKGRWHLPGGTFYLHETLAQAAKRIALEETGLEVEVERMVGVIEYSSKSGVGQTVGIVYLVHPVSGQLRGGPQARDVRLFTAIPPSTIAEQREFLVSEGLLQ